MLLERFLDQPSCGFGIAPLLHEDVRNLTFGVDAAPEPGALRTTKTKGCLSRKTALTMVFKLCQSASKKWRRLDGSHQIAEIIEGVKFKDGVKLTERAA